MLEETKPFPKPLLHEETAYFWQAVQFGVVTIVLLISLPIFLALQGPPKTEANAEVLPDAKLVLPMPTASPKGLETGTKDQPISELAKSAKEEHFDLKALPAEFESLNGQDIEVIVPDEKGCSHLVKLNLGKQSEDEIKRLIVSSKSSQGHVPGEEPSPGETNYLHPGERQPAELNMPKNQTSSKPEKPHPGFLPWVVGSGSSFVLPNPSGLSNPGIPKIGWSQNNHLPGYLANPGLIYPPDFGPKFLISFMGAKVYGRRFCFIIDRPIA